MILQVAYEIGVGLREPAGLAVLRTGEPPSGNTKAPKSAGPRIRRKPNQPVGRPIGFADGSLLDRYEVPLMNAGAGGQWTGDEHLEWDGRFDHPAPSELPPRGRLLQLRLLGPQIG